MKNIINRFLKQLSVKVLILITLFISSLLLFVRIADESVVEKEDLFDQKIHHLVLQHLFPGLIEAMQIASFFGSSYFLLPAYLILVGYFLLKKNYRFAIEIAVISLSSFLLMQILKQLFHRERPSFPIIEGITSYSFPSGHSLSSFIFFSILGYLIWQGDLAKIWKLLLIMGLFMFTLMIGTSRIVLNVHYATDVIAGYCLGIMWVILSFWLIRLLFPVLTGNFREQAP